MRLGIHSIKWRIQIWHGILLSAITIGLLYGFYRYEKKAQLDQIDSKLMMFYYRLLPTLAESERMREHPLELAGIELNDEHRIHSPFPGPPRFGPPGAGPRGPRPPGRPGRLGRGGPPGPGQGHVPPQIRAKRFLNLVQTKGVYSAVWALDGENLFKSTNAPPSHVFPKVEVIEQFRNELDATLVPDSESLAQIPDASEEGDTDNVGLPEETNSVNGAHVPPSTNNFALDQKPRMHERLIRSLEGPEVEVRLVEEAGESFIFLNRGGYREIIQKATKKSLIIVGLSMDQFTTNLNTMKWNLASIGAGVILLGLLGGSYLASDAIRPIRLISETAEGISRGQSQQRIQANETDSELGRLTVVLNRAFDQMDSMVQKQVRFTADASHELRTPITIIQCQTQAALQKRRSEQEYRKALMACQRAGARMNGLILSLLELARADSGRLQLNLQPVNLAAFLTQAVSFVEPLTETCGVHIEHQFIDTMVKIDTERMNQVITNLLTNAIQHNPSGKKVMVECNAEEGAAVMRVRDCGKGISDSDLPYLFERFRRGDSSRSRKCGGYGLGLSICKAIIEAHGGTIAVTSVIDQGSTFSVRLPLAQEFPSPGKNESTEQPSAA